MTTHERRDFLKHSVLGGAALVGAAQWASTAQAGLEPNLENPAKRRIIAINSSHRAGMTCAAALKIVLDSIQDHHTQQKKNFLEDRRKRLIARYPIEIDSFEFETELIELAELDFNQAVVGADQPKDDLDDVLNKIASPECVGVILASPVYFGLPSGRCVSLISRLMPVKKAGGLADKIFGAVAIGAGRNGGQETVLHALAQSMLTMQMILAVDAMPTSHWGATLWNQDQSIEKDEFGQATARNLGKRIAELAWKLYYPH